MSLLLLWNAAPVVVEVVVPGTRVRQIPHRKRRKPEWQVVEELTRDLLGPEPGSELPAWQRSEEDLALLILAEHL